MPKKSKEKATDQSKIDAKYQLQLTPAIGSPLHKWLANVLAFGPPSLRYLHRVIIVAFVSFVGFPFRWYESWKLKVKLSTTRLHGDPVFIIGHWRSGTTLIHNLMAKDPQFGSISMYQALFPRSFITSKFFGWFLKWVMPDERPMDKMKLDVSMPQEDELAMSNMHRFSMYNGWHFPWRLMDFYRRWVEFEGVSDEGRERWWREYHQLLKRTTLANGRKRIISKNPPHTARIEGLLKRYPNARFIHLYRNPYKIFLSTRNLYRKAVPPFTTQKYSVEKQDRDFMDIYVRMMKKFYATEHLIPKGQLVHVRFEDMEKDIVGTLERIYSELDLDGFEKARPIFQDYVDSLSSYQKNKFTMSEEDIKLVQEKWGFTLDHWGYDIPD